RRRLGCPRGCRASPAGRTRGELARAWRGLPPRADALRGSARACCRVHGAESPRRRHRGGRPLRVQLHPIPRHPRATAEPARVGARQVWPVRLEAWFERTMQWVPSLYLGGLTLVLAAAGAGFREGPPWRPWLTAIVVVGSLAALGEYTSPLFWARRAPALAA